MKVNILVLCDFAAVYAGRICITGAIDALHFRRYPVTISAMVFAKTQIDLSDEGQHRMKSRIMDADGKPIATPPEVTSDFRFGQDAARILKIHYHIDHCQNFQIPKPGEYTLEFWADGAVLDSTRFLAASILPKK